MFVRNIIRVDSQCLVEGLWPPEVSVSTTSALSVVK